MVKKKSIFNIALVASLATSAVAIPTVTEAAQGLTANKVVFNVGGQLKVISAEQYILAILGAEPNIKAAISTNGNNVTPVAVSIGGKYISASDYIIQYMIGDGKITQNLVESVANYNIKDAVELVGSTWVAVPNPGEQAQAFKVTSID